MQQQFPPPQVVDAPGATVTVKPPVAVLPTCPEKLSMIVILRHSWKRATGRLGYRLVLRHENIPKYGTGGIPRTAVKPFRYNGSRNPRTR